MAFTGAIEGIVFDANQASIRAISFDKLNQAAQVLAHYPDLRVEVAGHTDSTGKAERNLELSGQRAASVKAYLVSRGIAEDRIATRGAGDAEPVADNKTKAGRAKNRRIEFKLLQDEAQPAAPVAPASEPPPSPEPAQDQ
jgi:OOP family OmpA-OmpF porin